MSKLYENARLSIILGVEDYLKSNSDKKRIISSLRNFYAGILLLGKELIVQSSPEEDKDLFISDRPKVEVVEGKFKFLSNNKNTIGSELVLQRVSLLDKSFKKEDLNNLKKARNEIEHKFSEKDETKLLSFITESMPIMIKLFEMIGRNPEEALEEVWDDLIEIESAYNALLKGCNESLDNLTDLHPFFEDHTFKCPECFSKLLGQIDAENTLAEEAVLKCKSCLLDFNWHEYIEHIYSNLSTEKYNSLDHDADVINCFCTNYEVSTLIYDVTENRISCLSCAESWELRDCLSCSASIGVEAAMDGKTHCSYCEQKFS